ncbi:MAG TPA: CHAT domain-containing protein [Pirellulales bacterium]|jgi:tetratricopeptide (TPR) repeat protein|nr:CHAT domain-containing protein [Pirellulales bacterium]
MRTQRAATSLNRRLRLGVWLPAVAALAVALPRPAEAQLGSIPSPAYYATLPTYWNGNYSDALSAFQSEFNAAIKSPGSQAASGRWIDSICYLTMAGECHYHMGQLPEALTQYNNALTIYAAFHDWMLRVQFPVSIAPASGGSRALVPWGMSQRTSGMGQFPPTFLIGQGNVNNLQAVVQGGVVQQAVMVPISASEIVRCTTLAIRRRHELMGPVCKYDALTNQLITLLRRAGMPNNWSQAWVDLPLGTAQAAAGDASGAAATLERAMLVHGELDHPLTADALFGLGQLAFESGDYAKAARFFEETTYATATYADTTFADPGLAEEAFRYGQLIHLLTNQKGVYPPLAPALTWSRTHGSQQLHASLAILLADNLASRGETAAAVTALTEARGILVRGAMGSYDIGARLNMVAALTSYQSKQMSAGDQALNAALSFEQTGSMWMFQIGLVDSLYLSDEIYDRVAVLLYESVLRDPTPLDWAISPLEALAVLSRPHPTSYEHWFDATLKRQKEPELALEIADRTRRHRYLSSLPLGGRLLALRWVLDGPPELLNEQSLAQRQDLLTRFARYQELDSAAKKLSAELADKPVVEESADARHEQARRLTELGGLGEAQEAILREIAVRREPAELVFPPLRKTKDMQQSLPAGHALLAFFVTSNDNWYGFLFSREKYAVWPINSPAQVRQELTSMLRRIGNTDHNRQLTMQDLGRENWKKSAAKILDLLFEKSTVDLNTKFEELIIVPDGPLWYLPFEALPIGKDEATAQPLISQVRVRYAPTVGLSIPYYHARRPEPKPTGVVLGKLYPHDDNAVAQSAFEPLARSLKRAVVLPHNPQVPSALVRTLVDGLIVLDDIESTDGAYGWSPMQLETSKSSGTLSTWMTLPWGGPEWIVLPGFHTAAESGFRKGMPSGNDLFLATCGLMSTGVRTILISRWRPGGQSSFDLVREFAQELPHASAAAAWQRAVQLLAGQPLEIEAEPRLKKNTTGADPPLADHPFFWAAYMVVDSGQLEEGQAPPPPPAMNVKLKEAAPAGADVKAPNKPLGMGGIVPPGGAAAGQPAAGAGVPGGAPANSKGKKPPTRAQRKAARAAQDAPEN